MEFGVNEKKMKNAIRSEKDETRRKIEKVEEGEEENDDEKGADECGEKEKRKIKRSGNGTVKKAS